LGKYSLTAATAVLNALWDMGTEWAGGGDWARVVEARQPNSHYCPKAGLGRSQADFSRMIKDVELNRFAVVL
jgi:hypothetical protein